MVNGPVANAFIYSHTMKRENLKPLVTGLQFRATPAGIRRAVEHVHAYLEERTSLCLKM